MRMHIEVDGELIAAVDALACPRGRSTFVRTAIERAVTEERRKRSLRSAAGALARGSHEWDADPAEWVRRQRRGDVRRTG